MNMEDLIEAFYEIDLEETGEIEKRELKNWMRRYQYKDSEIEDINNKFPDTSVIKFNDFVTGLGLEVENVAERAKVHDEDITVIAANMAFLIQRACVKIVKKTMSDVGTNKDAAEAIKTQLDQKLDKLWHVLIVKGQYWAFYSHEPNHSLVFSQKGLIYIMWKTPGY